MKPMKQMRRPPVLFRRPHGCIRIKTKEQNHACIRRSSLVARWLGRSCLARRSSFVAHRGSFVGCSLAPCLLLVVIPSPIVARRSLLYVRRSSSPCSHAADSLVERRSSLIVRMTFARASCVTAHCFFIAICTWLAAVRSSLITGRGACAKQLQSSLVVRRTTLAVRSFVACRWSFFLRRSSLIGRRSEKKCELHVGQTFATG